MKVYLVITGAIFGLLVFAHVARLFAEGAHLLSDPIFMGTTIACTFMSVWAAVLFRRLNRPG